MKKGKAFFYRVDLIDLFDFATEPAGLKMTLLEFVKELKKGQSDYEPIQKIIEQTHNYMKMQEERGRAGGNAKAEKKLLKQDKRCLSNKKSCLPLPNSSSSTEEEAEEETETVDSKALALDKPKPAHKITDEEWLEQIKGNLAYKGMDFDSEIGKAQAWCMTKGRKCSRAFLLNWFNRAEKTISTTGQIERPRSFREQVNRAAGDAFERGEY